MNKTWHTQKGDEWLYKNKTISACADLYPEEDLIAIREITSLNGVLNAQNLYILFCEAKKEFPWVSLAIKLRTNEKDVERNLKLLQENSLIEYELSNPAASRFESVKRMPENLYCIAEVKLLAEN